MMIKKVTVDSILSSFHKTINQLETLKSNNEGKIIRTREDINNLLEKNEELSAENFKATSVLEKLRDLVK